MKVSILALSPQSIAVAAWLGLLPRRTRSACPQQIPDRTARAFCAGTTQKNDANPEPLTNSQRELLGKQLWHAFRHVVPPPFLTAFLTEYGSARRRGDFTKHSSVEPGFSDWIIDRHCENSDSSELRDGEYSGIILDEVANRMGMADDFTDDDEPSFSGDEDDEDDEDDADDGSSSGTNSLNSLSKSSNRRSTQRVCYVLLLRFGSSVEPPTPQKSGKNGVRSCYGFTPEKLPKGMCIRGGQFYYRRNVPKDAQGLAWHGLPKMPFWSA